MKKGTHLIIIGFDEIVVNKYLECVNIAKKRDVINGYSIIDLAKEKDVIYKRVEGAEIQPDAVYLLENPNLDDEETAEKEYSEIIENIKKENEKIKIYIATEVKYHERYLKFCVENGISCLMEKPVFLPVKDEKFCPEEINKKMEYYSEKAIENKCDVSVMTMTRYHDIYNEVVYKMIKEKMIKYKAPITSLHIRYGCGVWNLHNEFLTRVDHPYKYGYGMLFHGSYHYVDLLTQFLLLNKLIYPEKDFELLVTSYAAYPKDQNDRISKVASEKLDDNCPNWWKENQNNFEFGETDITSTFCLRDKKTKRVITLGTISLEQTTTSIRTWKEIPDDLYNKNGRALNVNLEVQLSTVFSTSVKCYKVPQRDGKIIDSFPIKPQIITIANGSLFNDEEYETNKTYPDVYNNNSNKTIMTKWLEGKEQRSTIENHVPVMNVMYALAMSIKNQGTSVTIDF